MVAATPKMPRVKARTALMTQPLLFVDFERDTSFVQQGIELGPHLILFRACDVTKRAFPLRLDCRHRSLWLMMIEIEISPSVGFGETLGILDRDIGAVERPGEVASSRWLGSGSVWVFARQCKLELLEEDRAFGKLTGLHVNLIRTRLDVDVVKFRKVGMAVIQRIRRKRRSEVHPMAPILRQKELP